MVLTTDALGTFSPGLLAFAAWGLVPYVILWLFGRVAPSAWSVADAGIAALAADGGIRLSVFVFPRASTAALALIFSPGFITLIVLPAGAAAGHLVGRAMATRRAAIQAIALAAFALAVGLLGLDLARPDLFPTTVLTRRRAVARIGRPRIVTGSDRFERVVVGDRSSWRMTGNFDDRPGDEIAIVDSRGVDIFEPVRLSKMQHLDLPAAADWNWYSRLALVDGRPIIVDTGGQETQLRALDGTLLWRYRPEPQLPPSSLRVADLDEDGTIELYAASTTKIARLDTSSKEVWTRPATLAEVIATEPRSNHAPPWVAAVEPNRAVKVWDDAGVSLGEVPISNDVVVGVVDFPESRSLALRALRAGAVRLVTLSGRTTFEWAVEDGRVVQGMAIRFEPDGPPLLAIVAAGPRDTQRSRLQLVAANREVVYDEVFDTLPALLKARRADGGETLLISGHNLVALRPFSTR